MDQPLQTGFRYRVNVLRNDDQLFLDVTADLAEPLRCGADRLRIASTGLRIIEPLALGKKITVPLPAGQNGRWEFLVQEPQVSH